MGMSGTTTSGSWKFDNTYCMDPKMINDIPSQKDDSEKQLVLTLPVGHVGVHFSNTVPCEISRIESTSPIFESTIQFIGRIAFHLEIPNKINICGALDNVTIETILMTYAHEPNRKLMFLKRGDGLLRYITSGEAIITTTVLPMGPINASFRSTKRFFPSRNRIFVESAGPNMHFEFPVGHYVEKVIIPDHVVLEGGIRTPDRLLQILDHFAKVPGRKIVFQNEIPRGGVTSTAILPKGHTGLMFCSKLDTKSNLPVISTILIGSSAWRLNIQSGHTVEKLIVPNEITIERMESKIVERVLNDFSAVEGRVIVLQELHRDIPKTGASVTITLPTGTLGVVFKSCRGDLWLAEVKADSQIQRKCPIGYYVESLLIPGELELIGKNETQNASFFSEKLKESVHVPHRIIVFKQKKEDVRIRENATMFDHDIV